MAEPNLDLLRGGTASGVKLYLAARDEEGKQECAEDPKEILRAVCSSGQNNVSLSSTAKGTPRKCMGLGWKGPNVY